MHNTRVIAFLVGVVALSAAATMCAAEDTMQQASAASSSAIGLTWLTPWIGPAIIAAVVALIGQFLMSMNKKKEGQRQVEAAAWADAVSPVAETADDIIARLFDIIVRKRVVDFSSFGFPEALTEETIQDPPSELTTVYRLIKFFAGVSYLQRKIPEYGSMLSIRMADFYAANKIRMGFKGNICKAPHGLPTETQQFIGSKFLSLTPSGKPDDLDFFVFITRSRHDDEAAWSVRAVTRFLQFDRDFTKLESQQVAVALVLIYMIDLYQDLQDRCKWEEFRVFIVSVVRAWNSATAGRTVFLYGPNDVSTGDYRDSFAEIDHPIEGRQKKIRRVTSRQRDGRSLQESGLRRQRRNTVLEFDHRQSPGDLLHVLESLT